MSDQEEGGNKSEQEPRSDYYQAARFYHEQRAYHVYLQVQDLLLAHTECDLSTYRFLLNQVSHVAVLGQQPSDDLDQEVQALLAAGEIVSVPDNVLTLLQQRRSEATKHGPWVEGHYRPGIRLSQEDDE